MSNKQDYETFVIDSDEDVTVRGFSHNEAAEDVKMHESTSVGPSRFGKAHGKSCPLAVRSLPDDYPLSLWTSFKTNYAGANEVVFEALVALGCDLAFGDQGQLMAQTKNVVFDVSAFQLNESTMVIELQRLEGEGLDFFALYRSLMVRMYKLQPECVDLPVVAVSSCSSDHLITESTSTSPRAMKAMPFSLS